jgi:hypothetical protein
VEELEEFYAETLSEHTPEVKTYEGFVSPEAETLTVAPDGSTMLVYTYSRKEITLIFNSDNGEETTLTGKYEAEVTKPANPEKIGYSFITWQPNIPNTFPSES